MHEYKINAIIQNLEDKKAWLYSVGDTTNSLKQAEEIVYRLRRNFRILSIWITDIVDNTIIFHECYVNANGHVSLLDETH